MSHLKAISQLPDAALRDSVQERLDLAVDSMINVFKQKATNRFLENIFAVIINRESVSCGSRLEIGG